MDPKAISAAIMAKRAPPDDSAGGDDQYVVAAGNILDAVKNDDVDALAGALRDFCEMCNADDASPEEDELEAY